jgi:hypothetical protein
MNFAIIIISTSISSTIKKIHLLTITFIVNQPKQYTNQHNWSPYSTLKPKYSCVYSFLLLLAKTNDHFHFIKLISLSAYFCAGYPFTHVVVLRGTCCYVLCWIHSHEHNCFTAVSFTKTAALTAQIKLHDECWKTNCCILPLFEDCTVV